MAEPFDCIEEEVITVMTACITGVPLSLGSHVVITPDIRRDPAEVLIGDLSSGRLKRVMKARPAIKEISLG